MNQQTNLLSNPKKVEYPNFTSVDKPLENPVSEQTIKAARAWRLSRIRKQIALNDYDALLLYDPINIRYALDARNFQVWSLHNAVRYALIIKGGPAILFEYKEAMHNARELLLIDEIRPATSWIYVVAGNLQHTKVKVWADEICDLLKQHCGRKCRLGIDKLEPLGHTALLERGVECLEGQALCEQARALKSPEELEMMNWTITVAEAGMRRMRQNSIPGKSEQEIWAELHFENILSGGEWIETRLLSAGMRTNPWFQECSSYRCQEGDLIAFDTDMIGPYGYCADISRSWPCGDVGLNTQQKMLYSYALEQIEHNCSLLRAGLSFSEFNNRSWHLPERFHDARYSLAVHGVGMTDE